jgi:hypothetical protein
MDWWHLDFADDITPDTVWQGGTGCDIPLFVIVLTAPSCAVQEVQRPSKSEKLKVTMQGACQNAGSQMGNAG